MRIVVADTSPINYLIWIDRVELLRSIVIPPEVLAELMAVRAPVAVASWIHARPEWVEVRGAPIESDSRIAAELAALDEAAGRSAATRLGLRNTGVLGVLVEGAKSQL